MSGAAEVEDLRSRLACVLEATYWDRPYDTRLDAIRGMCDLTTNGMAPQHDDGTVALLLSKAEAADLLRWMTSAVNEGVRLRQEARSEGVRIGDRLAVALGEDPIRCTP